MSADTAQPGRTGILPIRRVILGATLVTIGDELPVAQFYPEKDEVLMPWGATDDGKELGRIENIFGNRRREAVLARLQPNRTHDDFRYQTLDVLAPADYIYRKLTAAQTKELANRAACLSQESVIYAIARQEKNGVPADQEVESLLAEIDAMPEYERAHDDQGRVHRGRLIRILRRQVDFSQIGSPITDADDFKIRHGRVISRLISYTSQGDGRERSEHGIRVEVGSNPPKEDPLPLPKFPERQALTTQEDRVYSMMLVTPSGDFLFPTSGALFIHSDPHLRTGVKLSPSMFKRRFSPFDSNIRTFSNALRNYNEDSDNNPLQSAVERFLRWAQEQSIYAHYRPKQLADILDRERSISSVLADYKRFLRKGPEIYEKEEAAS